MNANSALWQPSHAQQSHINRLMAELSLPVSGQTFVSDAVTKGPSRQPDNRFGNSLLKHTSQKNNRVQALESRTGEYAMAVLLERDEDVIAYFCQPPQQLLSIANEEGKVVTKTNYTPDFLVARGDRFVVIEVRDEAKLMQHALKNPHQFYRDLYLQVREQHQDAIEQAESARRESAIAEAEATYARLVSSGTRPTLRAASALTKESWRESQLRGMSLTLLRISLGEKQLSIPGRYASTGREYRTMLKRAAGRLRDRFGLSASADPLRRVPFELN